MAQYSPIIFKGQNAAMINSGGLEFKNGTKFLTVTGNPETVITATIGSEYLDISSGFLYIKNSGLGNTGWLRISSTDNIPSSIEDSLAISGDGQTAFTLSLTPTNAGSFAFYLNGQLRKKGVDFIQSATTVTWLDPGGLTLLTADELIARYTTAATLFTDLKSILFGGTDEYMDCGTGASVSFERTDVFTLSCWAKATTSGTEYLISKTESAGNGRGWGMRITSGRVYFNLANTTTSNHLQVRTTSATMNDGAWHHIAITYAGTSSATGVNIYIDGVLAEMTTVLNTLNATTINAINVQLSGREGTDSVYNGKLDEPSIWSTEMNLAEVQELYNCGSPALLTCHSANANLVSWWRMGDGDTFPLISDKQGINDGTMTNMESGDIVIDAP